MIDIHHHLLPGLDDGAASMEMSLAMARIAVADGITHVVCTPHANAHYEYEPDVITAKIAELSALLESHNVNLTLGRGSDFHLTYDNVLTAKADPARYSVNGLGYLLVEIPDYGLPQGLTETFYQLQLAGLTPILTHPERNPTLQANPDRLIDWIRGGVLIQVTAGSILGHMGKSARKMAQNLLRDRWVHFVATDAHNTTSRAPRMHEAYEEVADRCNPDYAHLLCTTNPLCVFQGKPLPMQPEPVRLYDDLEPRNWWQRLVGK